MSRTTVCDRCGRERVPREPWLAIMNFGLDIDIDLCKVCADDLIAWVKS